MELIALTDIESKILSFRGVQVMLDKDLALFYETKTIRLREQVKRNPDRFPNDFTFQLDDFEVDLLVSQNAIPSKKYLGGSNPYVFTEQGVAALSGVLRNKKSANISISIFRAFVRMRHTFNQNQIFLNRLLQVEQKQILFDSKLEELLKSLESQTLKHSKGIFFEGQLFDAYVFASDLIKRASQSIIRIDNYVDETTLLMISKMNPKCKAVIYTQKMTEKLRLDLTKYNGQYPTMEIKILKTSHDRFLILDKKELYHLGASLKDLGKKWFAFSKIDEFLPNFLEKLKEI
jgi:hypothetical protein